MRFFFHSWSDRNSWFTWALGLSLLIKAQLHKTDAFAVLPSLSNPKHIHSFITSNHHVRNFPRSFLSKNLKTKSQLYSSSASDQELDKVKSNNNSNNNAKKRVAVIGAGWGGLSTAHALSQHDDVEVTLIEASPRVGGLVRDGFLSVNKTRPAEAGQHGFWDNYHNIFKLLEEMSSSDKIDFDVDKALTNYAKQGQYSPRGLEAIWPIYRDQPINLPTGIAQGLYTQFQNLSVLDRLTAIPLVLAFSEFDDSMEAWKAYDSVSFRDLCVKLGVSKKCYEEAFEPMILTGLFAPGAQCSAAAALGMAYFFVLKSQNSFDVRWCRGNIGEVIFDPWVELMTQNGVKFETSTRVTGLKVDESNTNTNEQLISTLECKHAETGESYEMEVDTVVFAVGAEALKSFVTYSPSLAKYPDFRKFANLRGTSVLATRLFLDQKLDVPYSANACWGFDDGVGMTMFDISTIHENFYNNSGSVIEIDYYHASSLLVMDDTSIVHKVKKDLDTILGSQSSTAKVLDAAIVRLPNAVNWYYPGSYQDMPDLQSESLSNVYFAGDIVRTRHGSWSQEKAYVTGQQVCNLIMDCDENENIIPLSEDESHVALGRQAVKFGKSVLGFGNASRGPSLVDFFMR